MSNARIALDWARLLGFNHAENGADAIANAAKVDDKLKQVKGASADLCISSLGAKIGSKQWVRLTD